METNKANLRSTIQINAKITNKQTTINMKQLIIFIFLMVSCFSFSQNGKIYPKSAEMKLGEVNTYVYVSKPGLLMPEKATVQVVYKQYINKSFPLIKRGNVYEFSMQVPDSIDVLFVTITDEEKNVIDNNSGKGYVFYLKNKTKDERENAKLSQLQLNDYANYMLKLNITADEKIAQFEELYTQNSKFKEDETYVYYLYLQYQKDKVKYKPELLNCAEKLIQLGDEKSLSSASQIYSILKMKEKQDEIQLFILKKYPTGEFAKRDFFNQFYGKKDKTEKYILDGLKAYSTQFNDSSKKVKEQFYAELLFVYLKSKDTLNLTKYESLITEKLKITNIYNNYAWELSGQDLTSPGTDLHFAESLSKKCLEIVTDRMIHQTENDNKGQLQDAYIMFADTYALLMYKQKKYDVAFQYQDEIFRMKDIDTGGKERYAAYAEKIKGLEFTKDFIEKQLIAGVDSRVMINQLQQIYIKLNLPTTGFEKIKDNSLKLKSQKSRDELIKTYGDVKAIDFTLTNLDGKKVKLSDYKGKMVVLDFWATWCGPCRRSFPGMQELVTKYKDKNIEFFFINTWERNEPAEIKKNVAKFISDNKYSFNVLLDMENDIVAKYKIQGVPTKIVIDKNGDIISNNASEENLKVLIEENI